MSQDIIILSDGSASDDEIAFVSATRGTGASPSSPVFVRASTSRTYEVLDDSDDDFLDLPSSRPNFDDLFGSVVADKPTITYTADNAVGTRSNSVEIGAAEPESNETLVSHTTVSESFSRSKTIEDILNDPSIYASPPASPQASTTESIENRPKTKKRKSAPRTRDNDGVEEGNTAGVKQTQTAVDAAGDKEAKKAAEKAERQLARDTAKAAKEAERSYQKKLNEVNRLRTTKIDALRDIELHLSHDLSLPTSPIAGSLPELRTRIEDSKSSIHFLSEDETVMAGVLRFRRHVRAEWDSTNKRYVPLDQERLEWDPTVVLVASADDVVDRVAQGGDTLSEWLSDVRLTLSLSSDCQILLLVRGLEKYHSKTQSIANRSFREAARSGLAGDGTSSAASPSSAVAGRVDKETVETALLRAQVVRRVFVVHADKTEDIEDWLFNLAGDVAIRPYKLLTKSHLSFSAPDHARKAQEPAEALQLMLQEVQGLTASASFGITEQHESFRSLMQAYEKAEQRDIALAEDMVADCHVRSLVNGVASNRKIGKALSKRVYNLMRGEDPLSLM